MIPANLLDKAAARRLLVIDRSARLIAAAQAFDHPETRLIIVNDPEGIMVDVVSRTDIVARISHCTRCSCAEAVEAAMTADVKTGVLAARDVLEPLLDEREHEESLLINYVKGIGY